MTQANLYPYGPGSHAPLADPQEQPACHPIKGNVDSMLYHRPDSMNYGATVAEVWFDSPSAAEAAGFGLSRTHPKGGAAADFEPGGTGHPCSAGDVARMRSSLSADGTILTAAGLGFSAQHPFGAGSHAPLSDPREQPACYPIKGNVDSMLYHRPDSNNYGATVAEMWFDSPAAAEAAGFALSNSHPKSADVTQFLPGGSGHGCSAADVNANRIAAAGSAAWFGQGTNAQHPFGAGSHAPLSDPREQPACYPIKGNVDSMLYHRPDSNNYGATVAEMWFDSPAAAEAAGFALSNSHPKAGIAADFEPGGSGHPCSAADVDANRGIIAGVSSSGAGAGANAGAAAAVGGVAAAAALAGGLGDEGPGATETVDVDPGAGAANAAGDVADAGKGIGKGAAAAGVAGVAGLAAAGAAAMSGGDGAAGVAKAAAADAAGDAADKVKDAAGTTTERVGDTAAAAKPGAAGVAAAMDGKAAATAADGAAGAAGQTTEQATEAGTGIGKGAAAAGVAGVAGLAATGAAASGRWGGDGDAETDGDTTDKSSGIGKGAAAAGAAGATVAGAAAAGLGKAKDAAGTTTERVGDLAGSAGGAGKAAAGGVGKAAAGVGGAGKAAATGVGGAGKAAAAGVAGGAGAGAAHLSRDDDDDDGRKWGWLWWLLAGLLGLLLLMWLLSQCGGDDDNGAAAVEEATATTAVATTEAATTEAPTTAAPTTTEAPATTTEAPTTTTTEAEAEEVAEPATDLGAIALGASPTVATLLGPLGLDDALAGEGPFTVFLPDDAAAIAAVEANPDLLASLNDPAIAASVLGLHVVPGTYTAEDIAAGAVLTTITGETLTFADGAINGIAINSPDLIADNGVIHVINGILLPEAPSAPELAVTGVESTDMALAAIITIFSGAALVVISRRREDEVAA